MKQPPAIPILARDLLVDTSSWTPGELGIYIRLVLTEWVTGPLPSSVDKLARVCGIPKGTFKKMWDQTVSWKFINNGNGTLKNPWIEEIREGQRKYRESQAEKGKKGADARWS